MTREKTPWQRRAIAAGMEQQTLATLTGHDKTTVSRQLRNYWQSGIPKHVRAMIVAWEVMTPEQRALWVQRVDEDEGDGSAEPPRPPRRAGD